MKDHFSRRKFLAAASIGLTSLSALSERATAAGGDVKVKPQDVRNGSGIEQLVKLIERTSREKVIEVMIGQLNRGVTYRQFVASLLMTSARHIGSPHGVMMINSAQRLSLDMPREHMLLPLFWALDTLKYEPNEDPTSAPAEMRRVAPEKAANELQAGMNQFDDDRAIPALFALSDTIGPRHAMSQLWKYAGRNFTFIGHRAIALSNTWRVLETIGWNHAPSMFEFVVKQLNGGKSRHWCHRENTDRSRGVSKLPIDWASLKHDPAATLRLLETMREQDHFAASQLAYEMLQSGKVQAGSLWDAVYLIGGEFMMSYPDADYIRAAPLHANTSSQALRVAFDQSDHPETRLYTLLQAVAWAANFFSVGRERSKLRPIKITEVPQVEISTTAEETVRAIFETQPRQKFSHETGLRSRGIHGKREEMDKASQMAFAFGKQHKDHSMFLNTARLMTSVKSTPNAHDIKFPAAVFDTYRQISSIWRPHILAASMHHMHSSRMNDNPATTKARELLG